MKKLIVIEGLDGSGKATQAGLLTGALQERGFRTLRVSFPDYASPSSALVKMYLNGQFGNDPGSVNAYAASSFYAVDRYASFRKDWEKDYNEGLIVADRYTTSNAIHQCSKLPEDRWDSYLEWLFDYEYRKLGIPAPDLVIYLSVDPAVSQELLAKRYEGHMEREDIHEKDSAYLARCRKAASYCAGKLGWQVVECTRGGQMRTVEDIGAEVLALAQKALEGSGAES